MAELTEQQLRFLELHVLDGRRLLRALDPAADPEGANAPTLQDRVTALRLSVAALLPPLLSSDAERAEMSSLTLNIREALEPPFAKAMVVAAERALAELQTLRTQVLARIQAEAQARAIAEAEAAARAERGRVLRVQIAEVTLENADPLVAGQIGLRTAALTEGWQDPPSEEDLKRAEDGLPALREAVRQEHEARDTRQNLRLTLVEEVGALAAAGADEAELLAIEDLKARALSALPAFPSVQALADAQAPMQVLRELVDLTGKAVAARLLRRDQIVAQRDAALPPGLLGAERERIATAVSEFPALDGSISADALGGAEAALVKLGTLKAELALATSARQAQASRIATALSAAAWGSGTLAAPPGAPAALLEAQRLSFETLKSDNAAFALPDAPDGWPLQEAGAIAGRAEAVIAGLAGIAQALEAVKAAVEKVNQAEAATRSLIAATGTHTLSVAQQATLTDRIAAARGLFAAQLAEADTAVVALAAIGTAAKSLQRDLRALAQRVAAVDLAPPGASAADKKVLAGLRKAALDAIEQVEP